MLFRSQEYSEVETYDKPNMNLRKALDEHQNEIFEIVPHSLSVERNGTLTQVIPFIYPMDEDQMNKKTMPKSDCHNVLICDSRPDSERAGNPIPGPEIRQYWFLLHPYLISFLLQCFAGGIDDVEGWEGVMYAIRPGKIAMPQKQFTRAFRNQMRRIYRRYRNPHRHFQFHFPLPDFKN